MDIARLRQRGWTEKEIAHLKGILLKAEIQKHPRIKMIERLCLWLVILALASGGTALVVELLPVLALTAFGGPVLFLAGVILGLFLVHVLHDLKLERHHQHAGVAILVLTSIASVTFLLRLFAARIGAIQGVFLLSILFGTGILIPYLLHWRTTHGTA